jgi:molybdopterin synthase catalytic subunit
MNMESINFNFANGQILPEILLNEIKIGMTFSEAGAQCSFTGQVRADFQEHKLTKAIEYSAYMPMAQEVGDRICREIASEFQLKRISVYHSLGEVKVGQLCLLVHTLAPRRKAAIKACHLAVERIKNEVPIWGKELLENDFTSWKINTP